MGPALPRRRRRLPTHRLPVRRVEALEVLRGRVVVHLLDATLEGDQRVADKQMRQVSSELLVDALLDEHIEGRIVHLAGDVVVIVEGVLGEVRLAGDVGRYRIVPALAQWADTLPGHLGIRHRLRVLLPSLGWCAVVHRPRDDLPTDICARETSLPHGRRSRQCQHDGRERCQLIVQVARFVCVAALKGDLQAATTHAVCHAIHLDVSGHRVLILENGHAHIDLAPAPAADVPRERGEARVRVDARVWHGAGLRRGAPGRCGGSHEILATHQRKIHQRRRNLVGL
mmetsp:Transcript_97897/g.281651  ORF Transcript_97897/g.281651 Transcript_97897/m.281651 type:complete len:285 (+) Transcript_97897:520-1374(+)